MSQVASRWQKINDAIRQIAGGNPVTVVAVSKRQDLQKMHEAHEAGARHFGESYLSEALPKMQALSSWTDVVWHYIGPMQSNKTAGIARHFDWVHSCDREKIASRLSAQRPDTMAPLNVLVQVNISGEASKAGIHPDHLDRLLRHVAGLPRLRLRGLMAIPEPDAPGERFRMMADLHNRYKDISPHWDTLSLGMSRDYTTAIQYGANLVRIGTGLFGPRDEAGPPMEEHEP
jgi:hypothetical protein